MSSLTRSVALAAVQARSQHADLVPHRELELLTFTLPEPFVFAWMNRSMTVHHSSHLLDLIDLLRQVGLTDEWAWLKTWPVDNRDHIAQACGRSDRGFVVEIGDPRHTERIVRPGSAFGPKRNVATKKWAYYCAEDELLDLGTSATLMCDWLTDASIEGEWEFRRPDPEASR